MIELDHLEDANNTIIHITNNIGVICRQHPTCRGLRVVFKIEALI